MIPYEAPPLVLSLWSLSGGDVQGERPGTGVLPGPVSNFLPGLERLLVVAAD
jgi:hypothetical protein